MIQQRLEESRLVERYRISSDEELIRLAQLPDQLTEQARQLLAAELRNRRVSLRDSLMVNLVEENRAAYPGLPRGEEQLWLRHPGDYAEVAPEDCVWQFQSDEDMYAACTLLALEDIPTDAMTWGHARLDMRGPRLAVLPEDRESAKRLLSLPLPESVCEQLKIEDELPDWSLAPCPECGAPDPLLTSVEPQNVWRCDECGHEWRDENDKSKGR